jgi:amino acid transporter
VAGEMKKPQRNLPFALLLGLAFAAALTISTIARLLVYVTTCAALPVFRRRRDLPETAYSVPFGISASISALGLTIWLLSYVDYKKEGLAILIVAVIGLIIFAAYKFFGQKNPDSVFQNQ